MKTDTLQKKYFIKIQKCYICHLPDDPQVSTCANVFLKRIPANKTNRWDRTKPAILVFCYGTQLHVYIFEPVQCWLHPTNKSKMNTQNLTLNFTWYITKSFTQEQAQWMKCIELCYSGVSTVSFDMVCRLVSKLSSMLKIVTQYNVGNDMLLVSDYFLSINFYTSNT